MNIPTQQHPEEPTAETRELPEWQTPNITRIEIKRTMVAGGSSVDGQTGTT